MSRTNIDLNDEAVADVMQTYNLRTKRDAVNFALERVRRPKRMAVEEVLALRGIGWEGDLEAIKTGRRFDAEDERPAP